MVIPKSILLVFIFFYLLKKIQLGCSTLHCLPNERNALFDFKQGFIDKTNRLSSWVGQDCCKWQGVSCHNFTGHVVKLDLRNPFPFDEERYLDYHPYYYDKTYSEECLTSIGEVNPSLLELKHLNYLDLSWNNFSGISIPKFFGLFSELTYLNLSNALFGGIVPYHLGNLSALHSLDLGSDIFYFYNPYRLFVNTLHWTSNLNSLRILDMSGIDLSNIPIDSFQAITSFPFLLELHFSNCSLEKIPLFHSVPYNLTSLTILDLSRNNFQGPLLSAFQNITSLKVLKLSRNKFTSNSLILDELKNLNKLEVLDLSDNEFAGKMNKFGFPNFSSPSIGDNLLKLDLSINYLTGYLPNWLHQFMSHLNIVYLNENLFEGEIPASFGALQSLKQLDLGNNKLSGRIPSSLTKSALEILYLDSNFLSGQIQSIGQLSKLTWLNLHSNRFHGVLLESFFAKLSKLKLLSLSNNFLSIKLRSGWVPPFQLDVIFLTSCRILGLRFPDWLQTQTGLRYLYMSNTGISDSIPNWFHNLTSLSDLDLSGNQICGRVPNFKTRNMTYLSLSSNRFEGSLPRFPSSLQILNLSNNKIHGPIQTKFPDHLRFLSLSNNLINGTIPRSLCKMMSLSLLDFSKNNLSGVLPHCLGDLQSVEVLDLTSNSLSGTIQRSFFHQSMHLASLHLSKNNFHGELPSSLQNCTLLSILDVSDNKFSGEIPIWIGKSLHSLRILKLSSNKYSGGLSQRLCYLNELQVLDVVGNNLSGTIPHCFGNFNAMLFNQTADEFSYSFIESLYEDKLSQVIKGKYDEYTKNLRFLTNLDLSNNNFNGKIPEQLTNLSGLLSLNLSRNHFTGSIPMKIGEMRSLESLDLSYNRLSGTIPQSISAATFLSHLNLSTNNLSGPIPLGNQFQTFNDPSIYSGNSELCGLPLEKNCTYVDRKEEKEKGDGDGDGDGDGFKTIWFYAGLAWGCVVGFWGFGGVLLFKKSWRYAYFQFINDIVDRLFHGIANRKI